MCKGAAKLMESQGLQKYERCMSRIKSLLNKPIFNLYDMSIARNSIYAFAIIWIVIFHSSFKFSTPVFDWIKAHGDCGVDIFFFLSGISLYFSYTKNRSIKKFYANRLWRCLPTFYIIFSGVFIYDAVKTNASFGSVLLEFSMIDYFLKGSASLVPWFLVAILIVYLLYPLLYKIFFDEQNRMGGGAIAIVFVTTYILYVIAVSTYYNVMRTFCERYFIILLGIAMGKLVYDKKQVKLWQGMLIFIAFLLMLIVSSKFPSYHTKYILYIPLTLLFIAVFSLLYKLNKKLRLSFVNNFFNFIGLFTLEIYFIHIILNRYLLKIVVRLGWNVVQSNVWFQLGSFFLSISLSIMIGILINSVVKLIRNKIVKVRELKKNKTEENLPAVENLS